MLFRSDEKIGITKREFHVGKDERYADYRISDNAAISRAHAEFVLKEGGCYLRDEGSLNHTYINGVELSEQDMKELQIGDVVSFADEEYIFYW